MIIGPNRAGKTTITNSIAQGLDYTGSIYFENQDVKAMKPKDRAEKTRSFNAKPLRLLQLFS